MSGDYLPLFDHLGLYINNVITLGAGGGSYHEVLERQEGPILLEMAKKREGISIRKMYSYK